MPGCEPHPQVLSPCADDAVSVGQVLGTRGDVVFDEYGLVNLTDAQVDVTVAFDYEKESAEYVFEYLYVESTDATPVDIRAVVQAKSTTGFTVKLSGGPVTATCVLKWHVITPDPLHTSCPATGAPHYAIVRPAQQGLTNMVNGNDFIAVTFPTAQPDNDWVFLACEIENINDPVVPSMVFCWTVSAHDTTGFRLELSGAPDTGNYKLRWRVG